MFSASRAASSDGAHRVRLRTAALRTSRCGSVERARQRRHGRGRRRRTGQRAGRALPDLPRRRGERALDGRHVDVVASRPAPIAASAAARTSGSGSAISPRTVVGTGRRSVPSPLATAMRTSAVVVAAGSGDPVGVVDRHQRAHRLDPHPVVRIGERSAELRRRRRPGGNSARRRRPPRTTGSAEVSSVVAAARVGQHLDEFADAVGSHARAPRRRRRSSAASSAARTRRAGAR